MNAGNEQLNELSYADLAGVIGGEDGLVILHGRDIIANDYGAVINQPNAGPSLVDIAEKASIAGATITLSPVITPSIE
jgi:hypothetical protein